MPGLNQTSTPPSFPRQSLGEFRCEAALATRPPEQTSVSTFVFIDSRVDNATGLMASHHKPNQQWALVNATDDGLMQMQRALQGHSGLPEAIHIISHGSQGSVQLGAGVIDTGSLQRHTQAYKDMGSRLAPGGDVLLRLLRGGRTYRAAVCADAGQRHRGGCGGQ